MTAGAAGDLAQAIPTRGSLIADRGSSVAMRAAAQRLTRQIEPPDRGVLVEVAQDVGQLQRAAQVEGERISRLAPMPKIRTERRPTALATRSQ